jgi:hypothetical protein
MQKGNTFSYGNLQTNNNVPSVMTRGRDITKVIMSEDMKRSASLIDLEKSEKQQNRSGI